MWKGGKRERDERVATAVDKRRVGGKFIKKLSTLII